MVRDVFKNLLISLGIFFLVSCSIPTTYSREDIAKVIQNICKKEFSLDVKTWTAGNTVWIYAPFDKIVDDEGKWDEKAAEDIRRISLSLIRVFLNMDKPPEFYCLVASDIKDIGADVYTIEFIPDRIKFQMKQISLDDRHHRVVFDSFRNPKALGDTEGKHIPFTEEITLEKHISYLTKQNLRRKFIDPDVKDEYKINDLRTAFSNKTLQVLFNIEIVSNNDDSLSPFLEAEKTIKRLLETYDSPASIVEIEITDTLNQKSRRYTKKALLEKVLDIEAR